MEDYFALHQEFSDYKHVLAAKKSYEKASNTILSTASSKTLRGDGEICNKLIYERLLYECKAGKERPTTSKGIRASSTYKKNCSVKIRLAFVKDKLKVVEINLEHENHGLDEATFKHYPENMRLDSESLKVVEKQIQLGVNKHLLKVDLMQEQKKNISLKYLHNVQTKLKKKTQGSSDDDILERLLERLQQVPNANVRVVTDTDANLIGIFFQDERMKQIFDKFPELMLFDGTYKMNNVDMPLLTQLCVDGNGETEICSIFFTRSESYMCVAAMVDIFQSLNPAWSKTKVILTDKDFADRGVYAEKYPDAVLQICLWHALVAFNREITTTKRNITAEERKTVLEIIQRIVYAESKESYESIYKELVGLKLEKVTEYFDNNWHNIRDEWTLFGRNAHANYLNSTNNRTESINQKFKIVGNRNANLLSFFENVFTTVSVLSSERDIRAVKMTMRVPRRRFTDDILAKYNALLTPFVFKKLEYQHELSALIEFAVMKDDSAITAKTNGVGHTVTENHCTCMFFSAMEIPCRHLFKFWLTNELELFQPDLCAVRWTKSYYYDAHPAVNSFQYVPPQPPTHVVRLKIPSEMEKYKKTADVTKDINNLLSNMSNSQFEYFFDKIRDVRTEMVGGSDSSPRSTEGPNVNQITTTATVHQDNYSAQSSVTSAPTTSYQHQRATDQVSLRESYSTQNIPQSTSSTSPEMQSSTASLTPNQTQNQVSSVSQPLVQSATSREHLATSTSYQRIIMPPKNVPVGRPKGSGNTVIGIKRKTPASSKTLPQHTPPKRMKFFDKNSTEQDRHMVDQLAYESDWTKENYNGRHYPGSPYFQPTQR